MVNGLISNTRVMTEDGIAATRARTHVLDVNMVGALEQTIAAKGTSLAALMERAGCALADEVRAWVPEPAAVAVLAGSGNNGGDGWVCARALAQAGWPVTVVTQRTPEQLTAQPARAAALEAVECAQAHEWPLSVMVAPSAEELAGVLDGAHAVVDAMLGTGFSGTQVRQPYATWMELANRRRFYGTSNHVGKHVPAHAKAVGKAKGAPFVIAADVPSGMSAQTGDAALPRVYADVTVTMLVYKPGLLAPKAAHVTGTVKLAPLVDNVEQYLNQLPQPASNA